jgi:MoxR-like ATPase
VILIGPETPRWIRELDRFIHLKGLLLVHGNVLDLVSYPVQVPESGRVYWTESGLSDFFQRYLTGLGYAIVGAFDPVDGLRLADPAMEPRMEQACKGADTGGARRPSSGGLADPEPAVQRMAAALANREQPAAFVLHFASRLLSAPDRLSRPEQALFTRILKASLDSREVLREGARWSNVLILVCDKINDLPAFLYLNNPRCRSIQVDRPSAADRQRFLRANYRSFRRQDGATEPSADLAALFSVVTDGFSWYELLSLVGLSLREGIPVENARGLCERYKYGIAESDWDKLDRHRLERAGELIRARIKGQEPAVERLLEIVKRARLGLAAGAGQRPRGVLFFAGPTGVGKTEMAKGLAELLFGEEERLVRFDMSELSAAHSDQKLLGAPPGYVGYEEGGMLTNAIKAQPFSVLLFDEIEKAHPAIFDKFLQILDDGRLTDGKGETVYFSEAIIIFTSNLGTVAAAGEDGARRPAITPEMPYARLREVILEAIRRHFNLELGRPEILNRFGDNFVVFDFIRPPVDEQILDHLLRQLGAALLEQQKIRLSLAPEVRGQLIALGRSHLGHGGRGLRNALETALVNPLAGALFDADVAPGSAVRVARLLDRGEQAARRYSLELAVGELAVGEPAAGPGHG